MTQPASDHYEKQVRIDASPETVFGFLTDPARVLRWMGVDAALDCRPGGSFRINVTGRETAIGEFLEVTPYERIVMTWGWDSGPIAPGSTRVEIDLVADGDATILTLRHFGLDAEGMASHDMGWSHYLERLALVASGSDPGADPWVTPAAGG
jgi:uncharacterized protein YndB with AHSA1/START domain